MSCGQRYQLFPSIIHIKVEGNQSKELVIDTVKMHLVGMGFEDRGVSQEMIDLLSRPHDEQIRASNDKIISGLRIKQTLLDDGRKLSIEVKDCTDEPLKKEHCNNYGRPTDKPIPKGPVIEVQLFESRPGGFSESGLAFNAQLLEYLNQHFTGVTQVLYPPPTDNETYRSVTTYNHVINIFWWVVSFLVSTAIIYYLMKLAFRVIGAQRLTKQSVFVVVNSFSSAPIHMQAATLYAIYLPNILAPWNIEYYKKFGNAVPISFAAAFIASIIISQFMFRCKHASSKAPKPTQ